MDKYDIVVLGGGESGTGAAVLAAKRAMKVFVTDNGKIDKSYKDVLYKHGIAFEEGRHTMPLILEAGEIIKSPGIPDKIPLLERIRSKGIPVISEIEFAGRFSNARMICVTGSNGKTTTTMLLHHILKNGGLNVGLAGNVGNSFAYQVAYHHYDMYVLEISSFQLDGMYDFKADIAIMLNITPDHLDRYDNDFEKYIASKFRIMQNQTEEDHFIYCYDDEVIRRALSKVSARAKLLPFSIREPIAGEGAYLSGNEIYVRIKPNLIKMTLEMLALQGKHNIYNSMAASIAAHILEIQKESIKQSLSDFQNIEHRLEYVANISGVEYINDSKATNINATWFALESMPDNVIWIAGGIDKGNDYSMLSELVREKVKVIICIGKDTDKIANAFAGDVENIIKTDSMVDAVKYASYMGKKGDTVLLSPACASFDLFENYIDRGNQFKMAVKGL